MVIALAVTFVAASGAALAADYAWPVVKVIDGDTVRVDASADLPPELAMLDVRIRGVDAPERGRRAKCAAERAAGAAGKAFVERVLAEADSVIVRHPRWGKWGGRVVADMIVDGLLLSKLLLEAGHARVYHGGRRAPWCKPVQIWE